MLIFIKFNVSLIKFFFISQSRGVSVVKLGVQFTYKRYGYPLELSSISNPKT